MLKKLFSGLSSETLSLHTTQARQRRSIIAVFTGLGFYVGVWAVLIADLTNALKLTPATLGIALACFPCVGIVVLLFGGFLTDRLTRRTMLLLGIGGLALFYAALSLVSHYALLLILLLFGGACGSCYDLAINTVGGDYERRYASKTMTIFHGGFSAGAALGAFTSAVALTNGIGFRTIYATVAFLFLLLACATLFFPLPSTGLVTPGKDAQAAEKQGLSIVALLAIPAVLLATLIVSLAFFTDGALEGYISVYLRDLLGSGALLGGVGIAAFYLIGMVGKFGSTGFLRRYGERVVVTVSALLSATGMLIALSTTSASLAVLGLLLVGLGQAPLVPTAFSLAAQVEDHQGARSVAVVTAFGYSIFLVSPPLIGALATLFSLRVALLLTIATSIGIAIIAQRLPGTQPGKPDGMDHLKAD